MLEKVFSFAKERGYDGIIEREPWKGYSVYEPFFEDEEMHLVGLPLVILAKGSKIRMSTAAEAMEIIDALEE